MDIGEPPGGSQITPKISLPGKAGKIVGAIMYLFIAATVSEMARRAGSARVRLVTERPAAHICACEFDRARRAK
jgi:hypothetical protein